MNSPRGGQQVGVTVDGRPLKDLDELVVGGEKTPALRQAKGGGRRGAQHLNALRPQFAQNLPAGLIPFEEAVEGRLPAQPGDVSGDIGGPARDGPLRGDLQHRHGALGRQAVHVPVDFTVDVGVAGDQDTLVLELTYQ